MTEDKPELKKLQRERKEEILLMERFKNAATAKLEEMARQSETSGVKYQMGEKEKDIVSQLHGMGLKEGIAAGILTFLVLRRGPIYVSRWVYNQRARGMAQPPQPGMTPPSSSGYQLQNPNQANNPFAGQNPNFPRSRNILVRAIWFSFDTVISLMMAASVTMSYTDTDKIRQQLTELPLVPGRSLTADALCDPIVQELQAIQQSKDPTYERLMRQARNTTTDSPNAFYLQGIVGFAENCQRRRFVEHELRQAQGLTAADPVDVVDPISPTGPRQMVAVDQGDDSLYATDLSDDKWMDQLVTDQEEQARRGR